MFEIKINSMYTAIFRSMSNDKMFFTVIFMINIHFFS